MVNQLELDILFTELLLRLGTFFDGAHAKILGPSAGALAVGRVQHVFVLFDDLALDLERERVRQVVKQLKLVLALRLEVLELVLLELVGLLFVVFLLFVVVIVTSGFLLVQGEVLIPGFGGATLVATPRILLHRVGLLCDLWRACRAVHPRLWLALSKGAAYDPLSIFLDDACHL